MSLSGKYFTVSVRYFSTTLISLSTLSHVRALIGTISEKVQASLTSFIFFSISSLVSLSILFSTRITGFSVSLTRSNTNSSPRPSGVDASMTSSITSTSDAL